MPQRFLVLSASMGAGHDAVAGELAERLRARGHTVLIQDVLALLPPGVGSALRGCYRGAVRHAPQLYAAVYAAFLSPGAGPVPRPGSAPMAALAQRPLLRLVERWRPDAVVSTFHLSAQLTGRLRQRGALQVPCAVAVIDFAVHRGWLHPGNDLHLCVTGTAAQAARAATGKPAEATGPVVPRRFQRTGDPHGPGELGSRWREELQLRAADRPAVLLSAGAWGVASELPNTARRLARHGVFPVLLCGRDERLRLRAASLSDALALGWVADMPGLMSAAHALVDNAAGQTAAQALAAGLPVIGYRPLPGHGAEGVRAMAAAGLSEHAHSTGELAACVDRLVTPGAPRERLIAQGRAAFRSDAAERIAELAVARVRP